LSTLTLYKIIFIFPIQFTFVKYYVASFIMFWFGNNCCSSKPFIINK
jgi:hypothetical protein